MMDDYKEQLKPLIKVLLYQDLTQTFIDLACDNSFLDLTAGESITEQIYRILLLAVDDAKINKPSSFNPIYLTFYNLAIETLQEISVSDKTY